MEPRARTVEVIRLLKYTFSRDEIVEIAQDQANSAFSRGELERQLDSIKADFKGRIGLLETEVEKAQRKIRDGYEMREIECEVQFHTPEDGKKRIVRLDTGEEVAVEYMLPHERQEILPFVQPEPEQAEEPQTEEAQPERTWPKYDPQTGSYDKSSALRLRKDLGDGDWFEMVLLEVDEDSWQSAYEFQVGPFQRLDQPLTDDYDADTKENCIWSSGLAAVQELQGLIDQKSTKKPEKAKLKAAIEAIEGYRQLMEDAALAERKADEAKAEQVTELMEEETHED